MNSPGHKSILMIENLPITKEKSRIQLLFEPGSPVSRRSNNWALVSFRVVFSDDPYYWFES